MFLNLLFIFSALLTVGGAILTLVTKNLMHSCIFLLASLLGVAGLYATLGADFVAAAQIMVYVGGIVILMLFAVMLTGGKDFMSRTQKLLGLAEAMGNKWTYTIAGLVSLVFVLTVVRFVTLLGMLGKSANDGSFKSTVNELGYSLIKEHVLAFELSSVLLLGALVGAAIIARPSKKQD